MSQRSYATGPLHACFQAPGLNSLNIRETAAKTRGIGDKLQRRFQSLYGNQHHHHHDDNWHHNGQYDHYGRRTAGAAIAGAAIATIGSIVYSLAAGCRRFVQANVRYWDCTNVHQRAQYPGSKVT